MQSDGNEESVKDLETGDTANGVVEQPVLQITPIQSTSNNTGLIQRIFAFFLFYIMQMLGRLNLIGAQQARPIQENSLSAMEEAVGELTMPATLEGQSSPAQISDALSAADPVATSDDKDAPSPANGIRHSALEPASRRNPSQLRTSRPASHYDDASVTESTMSMINGVHSDATIFRKMCKGGHSPQRAQLFVNLVNEVRGKFSTFSEPDKKLTAEVIMALAYTRLNDALSDIFSDCIQQKGDFRHASPQLIDLLKTFVVSNKEFTSKTLDMNAENDEDKLTQIDAINSFHLRFISDGDSRKGNGRQPRSLRDFLPNDLRQLIRAGVRPTMRELQAVQKQLKTDAVVTESSAQKRA